MYSADLSILSVGKLPTLRVLLESLVKQNGCYITVYDKYVIC